MAITVFDICRYPVKGLSAESLERVALTPSEGLPHDRRFAIAHGSTAFDPHAPQWLPKTNFLMLMRDEKLAQLRVRFDPRDNTLCIVRGGKPVVSAKVDNAMGRTVVGEFFAGFMSGAVRGMPKLLEASGHMFSDSHRKYVSLVNLASVHDLERVMRQTVEPLRFRANIYIEGAPAWQEFDWTGREIRLGSARLKVAGPIDRCAATNVNPETAERDLNVPLALQRGFGHVNMGIYAEVVEGGEVAKGDLLAPPG
ncbi:MAG: MOSC domain-containing protein [Rhodospirillales bacterium]|nr:MOSC domain-containing protein [Rhodospirillales bacterium]